MQTHLYGPAKAGLLPSTASYAYGTKLMIVRISVVVILVVDVVGGGGATTPGESICPAKAETVIAKLRIVAAHVRRRVFIVALPQSCRKICMSREILYQASRAEVFLQDALVSA